MAEPTSCCAEPGGYCARVDPLFNLPEFPVLPMAEIARRAGVGMATLYRHFPSRLDLIEELYRTQVDDICAAAGSAAGRTPAEKIYAWLNRFHTASAHKGSLASLLRADSTNGRSVLNESRARVIAAGEPLLAAAQLNGAARDDAHSGRFLTRLSQSAGSKGTRLSAERWSVSCSTDSVHQANDHRL